jgi:hypothetical protein
MANLHTHPHTGAPLIALADRIGYMRQFHPTMSAPQARADAHKAAPTTYAEAVSAYATLTPDQLPTAALAVLATTV